MNNSFYLDWAENLLGDSAEPPDPPVRRIWISYLKEIRMGETVKFQYGKEADTLFVKGLVGNEHCFLLCREGRWYVKDNHSSNGTAVNGEFLDPDGESPLADGDVLMLGHHADSVTFRIELK